MTVLRLLGQPLFNEGQEVTPGPTERMQSGTETRQHKKEFPSDPTEEKGTARRAPTGFRVVARNDILEARETP